MIARARQLFDDERYWDAIQLLELRPPGARFNIEARVLLARAYAKNSGWLTRAEELLRGVLRDDPENVDARLMLARIRKQNGPE